jgi:hypothetical protein
MRDGPGADADDALGDQAEIRVAPRSVEPALDEGAEPPSKPHRIASDRQPHTLVAFERGRDRFDVGSGEAIGFRMKLSDLASSMTATLGNVVDQSELWKKRMVAPRPSISIRRAGLIRPALMCLSNRRRSECCEEGSTSLRSSTSDSRHGFQGFSFLVGPETRTTRSRCRRRSFRPVCEAGRLQIAKSSAPAMTESAKVPL